MTDDGFDFNRPVGPYDVLVAALCWLNDSISHEQNYGEHGPGRADAERVICRQMLREVDVS